MTNVTSPVIKAKDIVGVQPMTAPTEFKFKCHDPTPEDKERYRKHDQGWGLCHDHFRALGKDAKYDTVYEAGPCPFCGTTIKYSVCSYNGHFRASCQTEKCFSFIE